MKILPLKKTIVTTTITLSSFINSPNILTAAIPKNYDKDTFELLNNFNNKKDSTIYIYKNITKNFYDYYKTIKDLFNPSNDYIIPFAEKVDKTNLKNFVFPKGNSHQTILKQAPDPKIKIIDKYVNAKIIVDLSQNILYKYDSIGNPEIAYLVASGKQSTPTSKGIRIITHVETYPYKYAGKNTKRYKNPNDYGPKIICLNIINEKTGAQSSIGEFIHGTNNPKSIGYYASKGCIRMDNEAIKILSKQVKRGDIVIIK